MHRLTRHATAAAFAGCLVAVTTPGATADPQGFETVEHQVLRFYGDFDADILLFTGPEVVDLCLGAPEPVIDARVHDRQDGGIALKAEARELPVVLYRSDLGAPEFIDATCTALFDDDPATVPVEPFAVGTVGFTERIDVPGDGLPHHRNSVNGTATDTDGQLWKVRGTADFVIGEDGAPVGDPADFQGLVARPIGS